jgi:hypothetical protein
LQVGQTIARAFTTLTDFHEVNHVPAVKLFSFGDDIPLMSAFQQFLYWLTDDVSKKGAEKRRVSTSQSDIAAIFQFLRQIMEKISEYDDKKEQFVLANRVDHWFVVAIFDFYLHGVWCFND